MSESSGGHDPENARPRRGPNRVGVRMLHPQSFRKARARKNAGDPGAAGSRNPGRIRKQAQCRFCTARFACLDRYKAGQKRAADSGGRLVRWAFYVLKGKLEQYGSG